MDAYFKQKLKRNVLFWGKLGQAYTLILIGVAYVYAFLGIAGDTLNMFMMMAVMGSVIIPITYTQAYFPTVISFGSGRKEAVYGLQFIFALNIVEMVLATWIAGLVFPEQSQFITDTVYEQFWLMLGMTGIGQIMSAICALKKSKGRTIILIISGCVAFVGVVAGVLVGAKDFIDTVMDRTVFQMGLTIGAILVYVISVVAIIKCTKKYEAFRA